jgi:hypothetical protein
MRDHGPHGFIDLARNREPSILPVIIEAQFQHDRSLTFRDTSIAEDACERRDLAPSLNVRFVVELSFQVERRSCLAACPHSEGMRQSALSTLKRISDSRAAQFWDKSHLIAAQVKQQLQHFHGSDPSCCEDRGHLWDMAAVYPAGVRWSETKPGFYDGPVYRIAPRLEERMSEILAQNSRTVGRQ